MWPRLSVLSFPDWFPAPASVNHPYLLHLFPYYIIHLSGHFSHAKSLILIYLCCFCAFISACVVLVLPAGACVAHANLLTRTYCNLDSASQSLPSQSVITNLPPPDHTAMTTTQTHSVLPKLLQQCTWTLAILDQTVSPNPPTVIQSHHFLQAAGKKTFFYEI